MSTTREQTPTKLICQCCQREVTHTRSSPWHWPTAVCLACFYVWYDVGDMTDPERIKAYVLAAEAAGTWPFDGRQLAKKPKY
jgi:hypothetical protein